MRLKPAKISVIMPVYNAADSIHQAIRSVLSQKGVSFELLIGNDASTDETKAQLQSYRNDSRIRIFHFTKNHGPSIVSNRLIAYAKGKYISSCDADDVMLPGNLRILSALLDRKPLIGAVYGDLWVRARRGRKRIKRRFMPSQSWDLLGGCFARGGSLIRKALIKKIGGYKPDMTFLEDCDLFLRLSEITSLQHISGEPLYIHNQKIGSLSDQPSKKLKQVSKDLLRGAIQRRYGIQINW